MAEVASAFVTIIPSARGFGSSLNRQVTPQMSKSGAVMGASLGKSMLKGFIAIGVATKVAQFFGDSVAEAREAQKVGAATAQIIKQTGSAANVTAKQVERLTAAMSKKIGVDDETIQTAANIILTFKQVRNEGAGVEAIFNRATRAAADLSSLPGMGGIEGAAKQLGKALAKPEKGVTALTRAGVVFTEQQLDQIKAMVAANDVLGAQKIILGEVESEFGGLAEAQATGADKAGVALANLKEQIGTALLPALDAMANTFANKIAPAISTFITNLQTGKGSAGALGNFIRNTLVPALQTFGTFLIEKVVPAVREALVFVMGQAKKAFDGVRKSVQDNRPQLEQLWAAFKKVAEFVATKLIPTYIRLQAKVLPVLGFAIRAIIAAAAFWVDRFNEVHAAAVAVSAAVSKVATTAKQTAAKIKAAFAVLPAILKALGVQMAVGLARGILAGAGAVTAAVNSIVSKIPKKVQQLMGISSPSKVTQALGKDIGNGLAVGIEGTAARVGKATEKLTDKVKEQIGKIKDQLSTARSDFASLVEPIASAFTGNLFDAETASGFIASLTSTKGQLAGLLDAFTTLVKQGLSPGFLYQLFQSGNAGLIMDLAANPALATQAAGLFGDVTSLSSQLGTAVAGATEKGKDLENQTVRLEKRLKAIENAVNKSADRTGEVVNGAAASGKRKKK